MATCSYCQTLNRDGARFCVKCGQSFVAPTPLPVRLPTGPLPPGTLLNDRYTIVESLGQGGVATVYRAQDTRLPGQYRAIKELRYDVLPPAEAQASAQLFWNEAQLLATLDHPRIPKVLDWFEQGGRYYLAMQLFEGQTLYNLIERRQGKPFDEPQVVLWGIQLCEALVYLHEHVPPIIFRDLKPENIVVDAAGEARLIDFGIARVWKANKTHDTMQIGTPGYAPPEQYDSQTDARSDVYALGAVMHHLLSGRDPQAGMLFSFEPVRKFNPSASPQMEQVLLRALNTLPDARYSSARAMQQDLARLVTLPRSPRRRAEAPIWIALGIGLVITFMALICLVGMATGYVPPLPMFVKTATPTATVVTVTPTPIPPTPTDTPTPTWTSTPTRPPTSTPVESETVTPTATRGDTPVPGGSVVGLKSYFERLKVFLEKSNPGKFQCATYLSYYRDVVGYSCYGCQAAVDRVRKGSAILYDDCAAQGGTRSIHDLKVNAAKGAVYEAIELLPR